MVTMTTVEPVNLHHAMLRAHGTHCPSEHASPSSSLIIELSALSFVFLLCRSCWLHSGSVSTSRLGQHDSWSTQLWGGCGGIAVVEFVNKIIIKNCIHVHDHYFMYSSALWWKKKWAKSAFWSSVSMAKMRTIYKTLATIDWTSHVKCRYCCFFSCYTALHKSRHSRCIR